jgi:integrase
MGDLTRPKCPKYTHQFIDRHGRARFYFRRPGFKKVPLPGLPWSPEFMAAREIALAGQPLEIGSSRTKPGTMRALAVSYCSSPAFRSMRSQPERRRVIERFLRDGNVKGLNAEKTVANLGREHIVRLLAERSDKPATANELLKALRALMRHAVEIGLRPDDPTRDVRPIRIKSDGYHSWTDPEIEQFEQRHQIGSRARLALALLLCTGQRRGDVVRMGHQTVRNGVINFRQQKTGTELSIPITEELAAIIAATPSDGMIFLLNDLGRPFTSAHFGKWFHKRCAEAGPKGCSAHGLRKAAARRLAEAGCTEREIKAITGHASAQEVDRYTRAVSQGRLARQAMDKLRTVIGQPSEKLAKKDKKD